MKKTRLTTFLTVVTLSLSGFLAMAQPQIWGMTSAGGAADGGVIFKTDGNGSAFSVQYDFINAANGKNPHGQLIQATNGKLYGMTLNGGSNNLGVLFEIDPVTSVFVKKFDFTSSMGSHPYGALIQASNGKLYGMTNQGGALGQGVIFEYDLETNQYSKKIDFTASAKGSKPYGDLTEASNGKLYGMTSEGGSIGVGALFEFDPTSGTFIKKIDFAATSPTGVYPYLGQHPTGSLVQAANGKLYGLVTGWGGKGSLFEYDFVTNAIAPKKIFYDAAVEPYAPDGSMPEGSLTRHPNGKLYGMTGPASTSGQDFASGTIFEFDPATGVFTKKKGFAPSEGAYPKGTFALNTEGKLYGFTLYGGTAAKGVLFEYDPASGAYAKKVDFTGTNGANPYYGTLLHIVLPLANVYTSSPADNSVDQNVSLVLKAKPVKGATTYTAEINDSPAFTGNSFVVSGKSSLRFAGLSYSKKYYVRVKTNLSPYWGKVTTFTTASSEFFAYATTPANASSNVLVNPKVIAHTVVGATTYTIEINTNANFTGTSYVKSGGRTQIFSNNFPLSTTHYIRVKTNLSANWGTTTAFTTGSGTTLNYVVTPANNSTGRKWSLNVSTNVLTGAELYRIQLSPVSDFTSDVIERSGPTPVLAFSNLAFDTRYYSRVSTNLAPGMWGAVRNFTTGNPAADTYLITPANNATDINWSTTLVANKVTAATSYTIEVNTEEDFSGTGLVKSSSSASQTFVLLQNQRYYARVKTNLMPQWSVTRTFATGDAIGLAYVKSPTQGATGVASNVTVQANILAGATSYTVELNTSEDFTGTSVVKTSTTYKVSFTGLTAGTSYFSRVKTNLSPLWGTTIRQFTTSGSASIMARTKTSADEQSVSEPEELQAESFDIKVMGNPFRDRLTFIVEGALQQKVTVVLVDLSGKIVHHSAEKTDKPVEVDATLPNGLYLLRVSDGRNQKVVRVIRN